jgi:hypothetical protein
MPNLGQQAVDGMQRRCNSWYQGTSPPVQLGGLAGTAVMCRKVA